jgi:hypothetical protein
MAKLTAKQVEGVLDTSSTQEVTGQKTFSSAQAFSGAGQSIVIAGGYIYWVNNPTVLNDHGNTRLSFQNGQMLIEVFEGDWMLIRQ